MRQRGFTLLELLVAMAVLALLGALGFRGLSSVLDAEARLQAETRRWNDLALLFSQLGEDMTMAAERPVRELAGRTSPALSLQGPTDDANQPHLVLTRLGAGDGSAAQSAPRRVGYRLREGKLEYLVWPSPDAVPGVLPAAHVALEGVESVQWQALDGNGGWVNAWPAGGPANELPRAISVRLALADGGEVTRILALR
jgi:general secretion pathway protein J